MIVRLFPSDEFGCGFYRCFEPARVLKDQVEIQIVTDLEDDLSLSVTTHGKLGNEKVVGVDDPGCDVVVFQRPAHKHLIEAIPYLQAHGVAVVCDYDDDFDTIDPRHPAWRAYDASLSPLQNNVWAKLGSQLADLVTVTTPALAKKYGIGGKVVVLPNYVPESFIGTEPWWNGNLIDGDRPRIGWAGHPKSHPGDLEVTGLAISHLIREGAIFRTIGSTDTARRMHIEEYEFMQWADIKRFHHYVASFDIGIVPLKDSAFNRAKSWLKGLEYAALGVPFVASPTKPYKDLANLGAGDLVSMTTTSTSAWNRSLHRLVTDETYRQERREQGIAAARDLTYERNGEKWLRAWHNAIAIRQAR